MVLGAAQGRRRRKGQAELRRGCRGTSGKCAQDRDWKSLFPDLMNHVLGLLPPRDVCRARAVCRYWNELVSSPVFVRQTCRACAGKRWRQLQLAWMLPLWRFLITAGNRPPVVGFHMHTELERWVRLPALFSHERGTYLVAATNGLYVYNVASEGDREEVWKPGDNLATYDKGTQLVVTNPWTGATKWLPRMLNERGPFFNYRDTKKAVFTLDIVDEGRAYIITAVNPNKQRGEVYDSRLGYWTAFNAPHDPAMAKMPLEFAHQRTCTCVRLKGSLYFMASRYDPIDGEAVSQHIISFNMENQKWAFVQAMPVDVPEAMPEGDCFYKPWRLNICDNKLVAVEVWTAGTEVGGQVFTLDEEKKVFHHETIIPTMLTHSMLVGRDPSSNLSGRLEVINLGVGHLLHFFSRQCVDHI